MTRYIVMKVDNNKATRHKVTSSIMKAHRETVKLINQGIKSYFVKVENVK